MASLLRAESAELGTADSIFTFTFTAFGGDAWGGWFVADSATFAAGTTLATAFGRYSVTAEQPAGTDLSPFGLEDGQVFVEWYRDAGSAQFLPTRLGPSVAAGTAGLGSEADAAWSGAAWDGFGSGGADLADAITQAADSLFTWTFTARTGDRWHGVLFERGVAHAPGDAVETPHGTYRILAERALTGEEVAPRGTVRLTGTYEDAAPRSELQVRDAGLAVDAGTAGLGSETGSAWDGEAWVAFGAGGAVQADADRDSSFAWFFHDPVLNDWYGGWLVDDSDRFGVGTVIPHRGGSYVISGETELGGHAGHPNGTIWINGFHDGGAGRWLETASWRAGRPLETRGLGLEADGAWDGDGYDAFGAAGTGSVAIENDAIFRWTFVSRTSGDAYTGRLLSDAGHFQPGQVIEAGSGHYVIWAEEWIGSGTDGWGTVWVDGYLDAGTGTWLTPYFSTVGQPSGRAGLGSEVDWAWDGDAWDAFGLAGATDVVRESDSIFRWYFWSPGSGDIVTGRLAADSSQFDAGSWFASGWGFYAIYAEEWLGRDSGVADGTVWVDSYFDAQSGRWLPSHFGTRDQSNTANGLGTEVDWVLNGGTWHAIGLSGWLQADF